MQSPCLAGLFSAAPSCCWADQLFGWPRPATRLAVAQLTAEWLHSRRLAACYLAAARLLLAAATAAKSSQNQLAERGEC